MYINVSCNCRDVYLDHLVEASFLQQIGFMQGQFARQSLHMQVKIQSRRLNTKPTSGSPGADLAQSL